MSLTCEKCFECFKSPYYYNRHKNKKIPCTLEEKEQRDIKNRMCPDCKHVFEKPCKLRNHLPICKLKPKETKTEILLGQILEQFNTKFSQQSDELKDLKDQLNKINVINNNTFNVQNNIIVTPYGKEDLSFLTIKDYTKIFNKGCYSIPEIVKLIHCNDDKPEFMNVYIKNFKDEYMFTFDGSDWDIEKKDDVLNNMIENKKNLLESKFDDMRGSLPKYAIDMFKKFLERSDDDEVIYNIKDELKNMFYKNRNHVVKKPKKVCNKTKLILNTANNVNENNEHIENKVNKVDAIDENDVDNDYICETNIIAIANENKLKKSNKKKTAKPKNFLFL
jgi:hypothetical protein